MDLPEEKLGETTVISLAGRIDSTNAKAFEESLLKKVAASGPAVVLDLSGLQYISSAGLRVILLVAKQLQGRKARFALCALAPVIREVFEVSGFSKIIRIVGTREEALA